MSTAAKLVRIYSVSYTHLISVDDIRAQINNDIAIKPYSSPYKIYIMNEAEKMTPQAQNAIPVSYTHLDVYKRQQ